jgi:hypothetical protein
MIDVLQGLRAPIVGERKWLKLRVWLSAHHELIHSGATAPGLHRLPHFEQAYRTRQGLQLGKKTEHFVRDLLPKCRFLSLGRNKLRVRSLQAEDFPAGV